MDFKKETHVVIIFPHPDDESFGTAGVIQQFRKHGVPVTYLCGTLGEMGRNMGTPQFANRETLKDLRKQELADACAFLDIDYRLLGYRDKTIEFEDKAKVATDIKAILEEIQPSLVITHYPDHGVHPDHNALGEATIEAVQMMDKASRPVLWASAITHDFEKVLGIPENAYELNEEEFEHKFNAILKHKSQAEGMLDKMKNQPDVYREFVDGMQQRLSVERFFTWTFTD